MLNRTAVCIRLFTVPALALGLGTLGAFAVPGVARAQSASDGTASVGVNAALAARDEVLKRNAALAAEGKKQPASTGSNPVSPTSAETPPPPITENDVSKPGFEGNKLTYSIDLSTMVSGGATDVNFANDPGGMDASLIYKIDRTTRAAAYYYQFSAQPLGNDDLIPVYFQGTKTPIAIVNGQKTGIDPTTHLRFQIYSLQQMFFVGGRHHPLVLAPTYAGIRSSIGGSDDTGYIYNENTNAFNYVHQRSYENEGLALAIPLFYGEKYLISYTGAGIANVNTNGANTENHVQYLQAGFAQYQPNQDTTFFVEALKAITYFPTDPYPLYAPTFHYGISRYFKRPFFIEGEVSTGGPSNPDYFNNERIGIPALVVPCATTSAGGAPSFKCVSNAGSGVSAPFIGAQRFTTFSLIFGFGANPLVRPF